MDTRIYVCTHKTYTKPEDDLYRTLHVGRKISDDLGYEGDDTGDHISDRNKSFCELTGIYWIWKNVACDIVGICHYRRYFIKDEDFLKKEDIEEILSSGYDVILPPSSFTKYKNTREHYEKEHYAKDLIILREILSEMAPDYLNAFDLSLNCNLISAWNMLIAKKEIFDEYCAWLFPILFEAEKRIELSGYDSFQGRLFGYLSERLIRVFFLNHTYRIYELEVRLMNPEDAYNQQTALNTIERLLYLKINDLLTIYRSGNYINVIDITPKKIDFHGKVPVWVCWWQGFDRAPEIVKMCRESWYQHLSADYFEIREITIDNYTDYITFPDWILERHHEGSISLTMLSDMLRMELLYRYGGLWMDATYFLARSISDNILLNPDSFYTIRSHDTHWKTDIVKGRWAGNFIKINAGNLLPQFVLNAFYYFFLANKDPAHYFMIDYFINIAYNEFPAVKKMIDSCPYTEPNALLLQEHLSDTYDHDIYTRLCAKTSIFKLSYKFPLKTENILGQKTIYGYLLQKKEHYDGIFYHKSE